MGLIIVVLVVLGIAVAAGVAIARKHAAAADTAVKAVESVASKFANSQK